MYEVNRHALLLLSSFLERQEPQSIAFACLNSLSLKENLAKELTEACSQKGISCHNIHLQSSEPAPPSMGEEIAGPQALFIYGLEEALEKASHGLYEKPWSQCPSVFWIESSLLSSLPHKAPLLWAKRNLVTRFTSRAAFPLFSDMPQSAPEVKGAISAKERIAFYLKQRDLSSKKQGSIFAKQVLHPLANAYFDNFQYSEALELFHQCLQAYREEKDTKYVTIALLHMGLAHQLLGNYPEAQEYLEESVEECKTLETQAGTAACLYQLGRLHEELGHEELADRLCQEAMEIYQAIKEKKGIASSLHQLGIRRQLEGDLEEAKRLYEEGLKVSREIHDRDGIASSLHQMATLSQGQKNYEEAERLYQESLMASMEAGLLESMGSTLHQLGIIKERQGQREEARQFFLASLKAFEHIEHKPGLALTLYQLGVLSQKEAKYREAQSLYQKSLEYFQAISSPHGKMVEEAIKRLNKKMEGEGS